MSRSIDQHLTDTEFINYVLGDLPSDAEPEIDAHLGQCPECAASLNDYFEAEESFPAQEFESHREEFAATLRERLGIEQVPEGLAKLRAVFVGMKPIHVGLFGRQLVWDNQLRIREMNPSKDGRYSASVEEDDGGTIRVSATALDSELGDCEVTVSAGTWSKTERMTSEHGVARAEFAIPLTDRQMIAPTAILQLDVRVGRGERQ